MPNLRDAVSELVDLVEHLVGTHVHWNVDLSKDEAIAKVAAAKTALLAEDAAAIAHDVEGGDWVKAAEDADKLVKDIQTPETPNV